MNLIARLIWFLLRHQAKLSLVSTAKRRAAVAYLKALMGARVALIGLIVGVFVLQVMVLAFLGALVTGVWMLDLETQTKLSVLFATFAILFLVPATILAVVLSERFWFRHSGAAQLVRDLKGPQARADGQNNEAA